MQINSVNNLQYLPKKQNFKGNSANSSPFNDFKEYTPASLDAAKAYTSPQIGEGYKEIETFDVPYVGKGKLYQLSNGHKVAIVPKPGPFMINTCVNAGFNDAGETSHFAEHLIYNFDTQINDETIASFKRKNGIDGNATTHNDYTNYWMKYPFNDNETIQNIIKAQAKMLQSPKNFKDKLENERGILISESVIRTENKANPDENITRYLIFNTLFGLNEKPKEKENEIEKIKKVSIEELEEFYNKYYNNNNMATFIVGDIKPEETIKLVAKCFSKPNNPDGANLKKPTLTQSSNIIKQTKRFDITLDSKIDKNIRVGFVGPDNNNTYDAFISLALKTYITDIKGNNNLEYEKMSTKEFGVDNSIVLFSASAKPEQNELVLKNIYKYAFDLTQKPISDKDLKALKIYLNGLFTTFNESSYVMSILGGENLLSSNKISFFEYAKMVNGLTKEDLQDFAKKYFDFNKAAVVVSNEKKHIEPKNKTSFTGNIDTLDTSNIIEYKFPDTNLQLIVDTSPAIVKTSFRLNFVTDKIPNTKPEALRVLAHMLLDNFDNYKSENPYISDPNMKFRINELGLNTSCSPEYTKETIKLVKENLVSPTLTENAFDDTKNFLKKLNKFYYDKDQSIIKNYKYGGYKYVDESINILPPEDYSKLIDDITFDDVVNLHKQIILNAQGKAILVLPKEIFENQKNDIFSVIDSGVPKLMPKSKIDLDDRIITPKIEKTKVITKVINDNNATIQQDFQVSHGNNIKKSICIELIKNILGVSHDSRLISQIREKEGLSYSPGAFIDSDGRLGYLSLGANLPLDKSNSQNLQKVLNIFKENIDDLTNNQVSIEELKKAKTTFKSEIIQNLEYSDGRNSFIYECGVDNARILFQTIDDITTEDIKNVAQQIFLKPSFVIIKANRDVIDSNKDYLDSVN